MSVGRGLRAGGQGRVRHEREADYAPEYVDVRRRIGQTLGETEVLCVAGPRRRQELVYGTGTKTATGRGEDPHIYVYALSASRRSGPRNVQRLQLEVLTVLDDCICQAKVQKGGQCGMVLYCRRPLGWNRLLQLEARHGWSVRPLGRRARQAVGDGFF